MTKEIIIYISIVIIDKMILIKKDMEILHALSLNARASLAEISKSVKMSKQAVSYRIKLLREEHILLGTHAIVNTYALGESHYRLFIKFHNMNAKQEQEFYTFMQHNPKIPWYALCDGDYDSVIIVWAKSTLEYEKTYKEIMKSFGRYFRNIQFSIATEINYHKHNFLTGTHDSKSFRFGTVTQQTTLDEVDHAILLELNKDARINLVEIANKHALSVKLVHDRIKKMQKNNVILGFHIKINHKKLGFTHRKVQLWLNDTSEDSIQKLVRYLKEQPSTLFIVFLLGGCDLEFELMTKTNEEYYEIMKRLRYAFPELIANYENFIVFDEPKSGFIGERNIQ